VRSLARSHAHLQFVEGMTKEFANNVEFVTIPHSCHWYAEENPLGVVKEVQAFVERSNVSSK